MFFFKQKAAYEMRISDWSSDVCSSDLLHVLGDVLAQRHAFDDLPAIGDNGLALAVDGRWRGVIVLRHRLHDGVDEAERGRQTGRSRGFREDLRQIVPGRAVKLLQNREVPVREVSACAQRDRKSTR